MGRFPSLTPSAQPRNLRTGHFASPRTRQTDAGLLHRAWVSSGERDTPTERRARSEANAVDGSGGAGGRGQIS